MGKIIGLFLLGCLALSSGAVAGEENPDIIVNKCRIVLEEMMLEEYKDVAEDLISKCAGVAIVPDMVKGGFIVGGSYGQGVVMAYRDNAWTGPAFIYTAAGSFGLQIGAQAVDLILVVIGQRTMNSFLKSKFKLGADVAVAAGPVGAQASAASEILLKGGIYSYSRAKGLFAGVSLEGAGIGTLSDLNKAYYGTTASTEEILGGKVRPPASAQQLIAVLKKFRK